MASAGAIWLIRALVRIMVGVFPRGEKILVGSLPLPIALKTIARSTPGWTCRPRAF